MSAQLGPGVRVYVGWVPKHRLSPDCASCIQGVIADGPYPAGNISNWPWRIRRHIRADAVREGTTKHPSWLVTWDEGGQTHAQVVVEPLLFPIDGGDPVTERRDEEVTA